MTSRLTRWTVGTIAAAGIGASALMVPATAAADPATPVPGTECTLGQIEEAIAAKYSRFHQIVYGNADLKEKWETYLALPDEERNAKIAAFYAEHPLLKAITDGKRAQIDAVKAEITATCTPA